MQNTIYEFWLMIYENIEKVGGGLQKVAMLTDFIENGRQKCAIYFPVELDDYLVFTNHVNNQNNTDYIKSVVDKIILDEKIEPDPFAIESNIHYNFFLIKNIGICKKKWLFCEKTKTLLWKLYF